MSAAADIKLASHFLSVRNYNHHFFPQETAGSTTQGFANTDSAFILSYSIVILNVDQVQVVMVTRVMVTRVMVTRVMVTRVMVTRVMVTRVMVTRVMVTRVILSW